MKKTILLLALSIFSLSSQAIETSSKTSVSQSKLGINNIRDKLPPGVQDPNASWSNMQNPLQEILNFQSSMNKLMRNNLNAVKPMFHGAMPEPSITKEQTDEAYVYKLDISDFAKDKIQVKSENGFLSIQAERKSRVEKLDNQGHFSVKESFGAFVRSFNLPEDAIKDDLDIRQDNDMLYITIPKIQSN